MSNTQLMLIGILALMVVTFSVVMVVKASRREKETQKDEARALRAKEFLNEQERARTESVTRSVAKPEPVATPAPAVVLPKVVKITSRSGQTLAFTPIVQRGDKVILRRRGHQRGGQTTRSVAALMA